MSKRNKAGETDRFSQQEKKDQTPVEQGPVKKELGEKKKKNWQKLGWLAGILLVVGLSAFFLWKRFDRQAGTDSSQSQAEQPSSLVDGNTPEEKKKAIETAENFLKEREDAGIYHSSAVKVDNNKEFWNVWFDKKDESARPNKGLIQIDKETGAPKWMELY